MLLVVDDNPEIRETLTKYLEKNGFTADQDADAAEAREYKAYGSYLIRTRTNYIEAANSAPCAMARLASKPAAISAPPIKV